MNVTDYSGRLIDLFIFQNAQPTKEQKIYLGFGTAGQVTTGIQKLSQTFSILFLTEQGSVPSAPTRGTGFLTAIRQGRIIDESTLQSEFVLAAQLVKNFMALEAEATNPPLDETLADATLKNFILDEGAGKITVYILLTSAAGTSWDLFLPLNMEPK